MNIIHAFENIVCKTLAILKPETDWILKNDNTSKSYNIHVNIDVSQFWYFGQIN